MDLDIRLISATASSVEVARTLQDESFRISIKYGSLVDIEEATTYLIERGKAGRLLPILRQHGRHDMLELCDRLISDEMLQRIDISGDTSAFGSIKLEPDDAIRLGGRFAAHFLASPDTDAQLLCLARNFNYLNPAIILEGYRQLRGIPKTDIREALSEDQFDSLAARLLQGTSREINQFLASLSENSQDVLRLNPAFKGRIEFAENALEERRAGMQRHNNWIKRTFSRFTRKSRN